MKLKSIAILSHKGGVGKTIFALNLAIYLAKKGKNVCLIDNDFSGPSLMTYFKPKVNWINNYLLGSCELNECLQDCSSELNLEGKLIIGFANPTSDAIQTILRMNEDTSIKMLHYLMKLKKEIKSDPYNIEYLIFDCNPGTGFSTVNATVITENLLFIVRLNNADLMGTSQMITGLKKQLKTRSLVVANQIPEKFYNDINVKESLHKLIKKVFMETTGDKSIDFLGWIPTDSDLLNEEFEIAMDLLQNKERRRVIHTLSDPNHPFSKIIEQISNLVLETE